MINIKSTATATENNPMVALIMKCRYCGEMYVVEMPKSCLLEMRDTNKCIQDIFPNEGPLYRESVRLMGNMCPSCQEDMYPIQDSELEIVKEIDDYPSYITEVYGYYGGCIIKLDKDRSFYTTTTILNMMI